MAFTIGKYGLATLIPLAKLMLCVYITMGVFVFAVLGSVMRYYKISILRFLNYIKNELLIVLGTSSSETVLPAMINKMEKFGCRQSVVSFALPAGYAFNLDGTCIYFTMAIIFKIVFRYFKKWRL
jgi:aerobic C4-dicarboxylate transport protein